MLFIKNGKVFTMEGPPIEGADILIRDGKIAEPVRGASLIGKGSEILQNIDMVGDTMAMDAGMCGSMSGAVPTNVGQPMIRVSEIIVGGRSE